MPPQSEGPHHQSEGRGRPEPRPGHGGPRASPGRSITSGTRSRRRGMELSDIDLTDAEAYVDAVPHEWFAFLRKNAPVWWHEEKDGPGFWCVTKYDDCVAVNREYDTFSSAKKATFIWELPDEAIEAQKLMMLNMDPPLHTRYRRLVNKGFTPRTISQLEEKIGRA